MRALASGLALTLFVGSAWAQAGSLVNAEVSENTPVSDPAKAVQEAKSDWIAFRMPALEGTRSPCCWQGGRQHTMEIGCSLETLHVSYGTHSDSPPTDAIIAFARITGGELSDLRIVGEHCPVDGGGASVTWIGNTDDTDSLDWLESVARAKQDDAPADSALYAMALHSSPNAGERLYALARDSGSDVSEEAVFWLGEARGAEGLKKLRLLLDQAVREENEELQEHVVFAISLLPDGLGSEILLELARDSNQSRTVRRQALFWLANSDDEEAVATLTEWLTG